MNFHVQDGVTYTSKPDAEFFCSECKKIMDVPYSLISLSDKAKSFICTACYNALKYDVKQKYTISSVMSAKIAELKVACKNRTRGCTFLGKIKIQHEHLTECMFTSVPCIFKAQGCPKKLSKREVPAHEATCPQATKLDSIIPSILHKLEKLALPSKNTGSDHIKTDEIDEAVSSIKSSMATIECIRRRVFEKTLFVLDLKSNICAVDLRQKTLDLSFLPLPYSSAIEVLDSLAYNQSVETLSLNIDGTQNDLTQEEKKNIFEALSTSVCLHGDTPLVISIYCGPLFELNEETISPLTKTIASRRKINAKISIMHAAEMKVKFESDLIKFVHCRNLVTQCGVSVYK